MPDSAGFASDTPHRRQNLLTGEWVLVSPHRAQRPWLGRTESLPQESRPTHDARCHLCPGNERAGGAVNPAYDDVFVFDNDFSALGAPVQQEKQEQHTAASQRAARPERTVDTPARDDAMHDLPGERELLRAEPEDGICRVVCFSPRHDLTLPELEPAAIRRVIDVWTEEYRALGARRDIAWVQIFENKGELMGCSNPHPHGQIWAQRSLPGEAVKEGVRQLSYFREHGRSLLTDYLRLELQRNERIVLQNEGFVALVPFWAVWPFETLVASREHRRSLLDLSDRERDWLGDILRRLTTRYDNLFETSFPYSAGIHQAPTDADEHAEWHLHMHFYPPLLRSATVRKFMVGYEMLGEPQRDLTPETAAERLRMQSDVHYSVRQRT